MPQSLASLPVHLTFSTKGRVPILGKEVRVEFHRYGLAVLRNLRSPVILMNSVEDHVHVLFELARTVSVSEAVEQVKKATSKWVKSQGAGYADFAWQAGYGAFGLSKDGVAEVRPYIAGQEQHHRAVSFQEEYRAFLDAHGVEYDEKHVWN